MSDATTPIDWLLDTDPALPWQAERDLASTDETVWKVTRARVATEGMGARLLALQDTDGQWAGGAYFPASGHPTAWRGGQQGQPWTATDLDGTVPDPRLADAVGLIRSKRQPDGSRRQDVHHPGQEWFAVGEPSPWLTLYATRVLRWWDAEERTTA